VTLTTQHILPLSETVRPDDPGAVAEVLRAACRDETPVYPLGGGTQLGVGAPATRTGVGLALSALDRVIDHAADDMTVTVQAGITLAQLQQTLAQRRQWLPIDAVQPERATIGGLLATGRAGPRRFGHGTLRDYLLGVQAVDGRGESFAAGGRVVKNAAGYNLTRLMVGSLGTLGVMTEMTLMVRPRPEATAMLARELSDWSAADELLDNLVDSPVRPVSVDLVATRAITEAATASPRPIGNEHTAAGGDWPDSLRANPSDRVGWLLVGFEGLRAEVDGMLETLRADWTRPSNTAAGRVGEVVQLDAADAVRAWSALTEHAAELRVGVRPSRLIDATRRCLDLLPDARLVASAGDGVLCIGLDDRTLSEGGVGLVVEQLRPAIADLQGYVTIAHTATAATDDEPLSTTDVWGPASAEWEIMRAIKERFDPRGILNPGRFVFV